MGNEELPPEAAAVAAFLSDISGFLDDEGGHQASPLAVTEQHQLTERTLAEAKSSLPVDEAERKRVLRNFKTGKRRDAYRKRLKQEWQALRSEEVELTVKLEELRGRRRTDRGGVARSAWRAIAMRQLEGRIIAEAQQDKLRTAVKRRREVLQDVESSLQKRLKETEDVRGTRSTRHEHTDEHLFDAYLGELDAIYAKTDAVFQSSEMTPTTGPFLTTKPPVKRDGDAEYLENVGVLYAPFDFERTCLAVWEVTRQSYRQLDRQEYTAGIAPCSNTIAVRFRVKSKLLTGRMVSMSTHFVSRRYVEADRMVIVWRELWEGEGEFEGMHSDETGWCIVHPGDDVDTGRASPTDEAATIATVIKTCVRLVPMHFSSNVSCNSDFDRFTEVLVTSGKEDNLQVEQMMERMQLGDAEELDTNFIFTEPLTPRRSFQVVETHESTVLIAQLRDQASLLLQELPQFAPEQQAALYSSSFEQKTDTKHGKMFQSSTFSVVPCSMKTAGDTLWLEYSTPLKFPFKSYRYMSLVDANWVRKSFDLLLQTQRNSIPINGLMFARKFDETRRTTRIPCFPPQDFAFDATTGR